jgi:NADH-quinone oxidoreductase subunit L
MFRLVFLTFHGERRHDAPAPVHVEEEEPAAASAHGDSHGHAPATAHRPAAATAATHDAHGHDAHGGHLHDAPPAMALALILLAVGSIVAGYIGVPHALGGHNSLGEWLAPSFQAMSGTVAGGGAVTEAAESAAAEGGSLELTLMLLSSTVAILGIAIAAFIWLKRRDIAASMASNLSGLHRLLMNKYYVDEVYDATVVHPIHVISEEGLWRGFDIHVADGAVNGTASIVGASAALLRRVQTGSVRTYAGSLLVGVVLILGYYLWR